MKNSKIAALILLALMVFSSFSLAKERRGAEVMITKQDGTQVSGELIAVKKESLLLLVGGPVAETDHAVALAEINEVKIIKKSRAGIGICCGLLIGGCMGALIALPAAMIPRVFTALQPRKKLLSSAPC